MTTTPNEKAAKETSPELDQLPTLENRVEEVIVANTVANDATLRPADTGFGAWSFLFAAFSVETVVWGLPVSYGIFLAAYLKDPRYAQQKHATSLLPLIGTLCMGIMYCSGLVMYPLIARFPLIRRQLAWAGAVICWASLLGASYVHDVKALLVLQGVCYGIGGSLIYPSCISYMSEWFVARRGLANGVITAGTSMGGLILPIVLPGPIGKWGTERTMRGLSVAVLVILGPILPLIRGRLPEDHIRRRATKPDQERDRSWLRSPMVWSLMTMNTVQGLAYYLPSIWLPTFATSINLSLSQSTLAVGLLNGAAALGRIALGHCADSLDAWLLAPFTLVLSSASVLVLWGVPSPTAGTLIAFGIVYGLVAGSWFSLWAALLRPISRDDPVLSTTLYGWLLITTGIGAVLSTPIATVLVKVGPSIAPHLAKVASGYMVGEGRYEGMIVYVGVCFAAAAAMGLAGWCAQRKRRR